MKNTPYNRKSLFEYGSRVSLLVVVLLIIPFTLSAQSQLAFPEAQGWGRFACGGRNGKVYHVTNLNDSGTGSFRDAVSQPNRIVVFDVAGVINISSRISFASNLYVAGQTAPGEGITIYGDGVSFSGANNLICRYLRVRMGHGGTSGKDCAGVAHGTNMIFDHCSFSWGLDETFSINSDGKGDLGEITIQNCIIGQGLMSHSAGGLIQADDITLYRNFYCDNSTRNNKVKGRNQFANNIVYNWSNAAYIMGGDSEGQSYCNIQGNLFINGPSGGGAAFTGGNANFHFYGDDNWQDRTADGKLNPFSITDYSSSDRQSTPYNYPKLEVISGKQLITEILPSVGASLPYRDMTDCYMIDEVMSYGLQGELIGNEASLPYGIPSSWSVYHGTKLVDSDNDGMPDDWEIVNGTNPQKDDAMLIANNGYANIENYINSISASDSEFYLRTPMCVKASSSSTSTITLQWYDYTQGEDGFIIECQNASGDWIEVGRTQANAVSYRITDLSPATEYVIRIRAFGSSVENLCFSDYSATLKAKTRPEEVGIIDINTFLPEFTWMPVITSWSANTNGWLEGNSWVNDGYSSVLFDVNRDAVVDISEQITPSVIVVKGESTLTFSGSGSIGGETTSLNKAGNGKLIINNLNTYKGATVLHDGVIEFNSLKNGGEASAIGASQEFSQNWIMDGGTYRYTGPSTKTNRSAKLLSNSAIEVSKSNSYVQMSGSIEGDKSLTIGGKGKIDIPSTSFFQYTGQTILSGGELSLSTVEASKGGVGQSCGVVFAGGKLSTKGENESYETYSFPLSTQLGTNSVFAPYRNCYITSTLTGPGTLQLDIPYVREYIKGNWTSFSGRLIANALSSGNIFLAEKSHNMPNAVVELRNGARACNWTTNGDATLGGLSGQAGTQLCGSSKQENGFTCSWHIGSANTNETFAGVINNYSCSGSGHQGTVSIEKTGKGYWRLTGNNEYSGTTIVTAGRLIVNGAHTGTGLFTVANGAILSGQGTIPGNITVKRGGVLMSGDSLIGSKKFYLKGLTSLQSGAKLRVMLRISSTGVISNHIDASNIQLGSGAILEIDMDNISEPLPSDKTVRVFTSGSSIKGKFQQIIPARPSENQIWDDTELYTKGVLYVRDETNETSVQAIDTKSDVKHIYDIKGMPVHSTSDISRGIVIVQKDGKSHKVLSK